MDQSQNENKIDEIRLDRKSKIFFLVLAIFIAGSIGATYWRYVIQKDYIIQAQIDCDPETEKCFVWRCDPLSSEEGEKCTGDPEKDIWYYKIFRRNAKNIPSCDPSDENCPAYACGEEEKDCAEELCTSENVPEGEECNDPERYLFENPPLEEECAEDDEECLVRQKEESAECEEGDEECLMKEEKEEETSTGTGKLSAEEAQNGNGQPMNVPPPGVEPQ